MKDHKSTALITGQNRDDGWPRGQGMVMERNKRARLLIADDHLLLAEACKNLLEPEFEVVAIVGDGRALLQMAAELKPDVVIVDIAMPQLNGLDAGEQVKHFLPSVKLVFLTMSLESDVAAEAFRRGASGYVVKTSAAEELILAIRRVLKGESYLSPMITQDTVNFLLRSGQIYDAEKRISARQREVLQLLAEGKSMKEIANILNLKPGTVAFHKYSIMERLGLKTNAELLQYAIKRHIIPS
jgi:DNA-binding NarL/FixJ family response regulator